MECNKDEALRAKEIAERKFMSKDISGARKFALKAQNLFPLLEGINQMVATFDIYLASEGKIFGEMNWYAVLCLNPSADEDTIKKQYKKFALQLHPDKNKSIGADGAFKLISEAWRVLSDKTRRMIYDQKINVKGSRHRMSHAKGNHVTNTSTRFYTMTKSAASRVQAPKNDSHAAPVTVQPSSHPLKPKTFWTLCNHCNMQYEYVRLYLNHKLLCPNCHEPFLASEIVLPANGARFPWSASQQFDQNSSRNTKYAYCLGKNNSNFSGKRTAEFQHGSKQGSYNNHNFQWGAFSRTAGAASASASSAAAAQAANVVHQTYEKVRKEREEAHAAARRAEAFQRKNTTLKRSISSSATYNARLGNNLPTKKRRGVAGDDRNDNGGVFTGHIGSYSVECIHGVSVDLSQCRMNAAEDKFSRVIAHVDMHSMLIERTKLAIHSKLEEWHTPTRPKKEEKENVKRLSEDDKEKIKVVVHDDSTDQDIDGFKNGAKQCTSKKNSLNENSDDSDDEIYEAISILVPDPDFHDFDNDRLENSFKSDQVWATYDEEDGMPRYYALIQKVISFKPFKVGMSFLTSKSNSEFGSLNWVSSGFAKTCGDFRVGKYEVNETINIFSHKVKFEKGPRGVIKIVPRKGEIWALYRNWSPQWNEHTPDDAIYKYDMVEVLDDYSEELGITVIPLGKVAGFKTVFCRHLDPKEVKTIRNEEMFRFSHQVPSYFLTGEEAENAPKGCHELDPAATPLELLQVITERKPDAALEDFEQTTKL
ncbi:hypothetical protein Cni_G12450 [Canna indica]|uniref:J domain-containing protein n=1 Tax=Canna indica TaxID=4628 RepID=A0AAQ3K8B0_9LILI|nr:hypothetical protein Cni_G12450 [Canna indica]